MSKSSKQSKKTTPPGSDDFFPKVEIQNSAHQSYVEISDATFNSMCVDHKIPLPLSQKSVGNLIQMTESINSSTTEPSVTTVFSNFCSLQPNNFIEKKNSDLRSTNYVARPSTLNLDPSCSEQYQLSDDFNKINNCYRTSSGSSYYPQMSFIQPEILAYPSTSTGYRPNIEKSYTQEERAIDIGIRQPNYNSKWISKLEIHCSACKKTQFPMCKSQNPKHK